MTTQRPQRPRICRTCAHYRVVYAPGPRNACGNPAFPRKLDLVTGRVTLPSAGTLRADAEACGAEGAGWVRAGLARRLAAWLETC